MEHVNQDLPHRRRIGPQRPDAITYQKDGIVSGVGKIKLSGVSPAVVRKITEELHELGGIIKLPR